MAGLCCALCRCAIGTAAMPSAPCAFVCRSAAHLVAWRLSPACAPPPPLGASKSSAQSRFVHIRSFMTKRRLLPHGSSSRSATRHSPAPATLPHRHPTTQWHAHPGTPSPSDHPPSLSAQQEQRRSSKRSPARRQEQRQRQRQGCCARTPASGARTTRRAWTRTRRGASARTTSLRCARTSGMRTCRRSARPSRRRCPLAAWRTAPRARQRAG